MARRTTREDRIWRAQVLRRDGGCVICGSKKGRQAHHLNSYSYFPDERYNIDNGVTLCGSDKSEGIVGCHTVFHTSFKRSYKQKTTKEDFEQFKELLIRMKNKIIILQ